MSEALFDRWLFRNGNTVGTVIQSRLFTTGETQVMTTTIPQDDTIPTSSEGTELSNLLCDFTPKRVGNKVRVTVNLFFASSASVNVACALYKNSSSAAAAVSSNSVVGSGSFGSISFFYEESIVDLSNTVFRLRLGPSSAATITLNGAASARLYGGVAVSSVLVEEIQV